MSGNESPPKRELPWTDVEVAKLPYISDPISVRSWPIAAIMRAARLIPRSAQFCPGRGADARTLRLASR